MDARHQFRAGLIGLAAGLFGALSAVVLLVWPPSVGEEVFSHPFGRAGFSVAQVWFAVHHLGLVLASAALARAVPARRSVRLGSWSAAAGMAGLSATELLAIRYADWDTDSANAGPIGTAYGLCTAVIGLGMIVAGVGVARSGGWSSWRRWTPLAIGIAAFAVVTPGVFGGFVIARLSIGFWMLLFAALGWALLTAAGAGAPATGSNPLVTLPHQGRNLPYRRIG